MATTDGTKIVTPVARIVWGHPCKQRQRTDNNNKPIIKADGTPAMQYIFGLAIPKDQFGPIWAAMSAEAAKGYPQGAPQNFAWKYDDGDDTRPVNGGGTPYAQREGYPGCYVLTIASALDNPPPVFKFNPQTGGYDQLPADQIKTGDFVSVSLGISCNVPEQRTHTPSLYLNPDGLEFVGYGKEIQSASAINPMQAFGGRQHQLPPGASATPVSSAPAGVGMPQQQQPPQMQPMPGQPASYPAQQPMTPGGHPQYAPPPMQQQPPAYQQPAPQQQPGGYPPPATDFVQNAGYPAQQPMQPQQFQQPAGMPGQPPQMQPGGYGQPAPMQQQPGGYQQMPGQMPPR
jgi:hypothetical protein